LNAKEEKTSMIKNMATSEGVKEYYGRVLPGTKDLKTSTLPAAMQIDDYCCAVVAEHITSAELMK
jgi:hypothetical protein